MMSLRCIGVARGGGGGAGGPGPPNQNTTNDKKLWQHSLAMFIAVFFFSNYAQNSN